jgi:hypothetical protein
MGASLTEQAQFYEVVFARMQREPRIRAAVILQLVDWDPDLVDSAYTQPALEEGIPEATVRRYAESLETAGLIRYADGSVRPSWEKVLEYIGIFSSH